MSHFKHLVLEDRITIQSDLHDGLSFKKIASHINHDCTTVSSEIRNHLTVVDDMWPTNRKHNRCIHYVDCKKRHICNFCQSTKNTLCKYCNQVACSKSCPDYKEEVCDRLSKAPYVCNGCDSMRRCPLQKKFYDAKPIDMPRAVRRKLKKNQSINHKVDSKCRQGRNFDDYHAYMKEHPDSIVCQIDTVEGKKGGKCILTLCFVTLKFQFGILREHNDSRSVTQAFQYLYSIMDHNLFHLLFDVILTDNGTEFSNPTAIESLDDNGIHPHVFYCEPNRSDQKGSCENDHSNFRRIVPKGTNMDPYTQELIDLIFSHVNSFSRTSLNGHTPYESFRFLYGQDILDLWHIRYIKPNDVILKPFLVNQFFKNEGECHDDVH